MRKIKAQKLTKEAFAPFGSYYNLTKPEGPHLGSFYHDPVRNPVSGSIPMAFSSLVTEKPDKMIIDSAEYHNTTGEVILPLDGDVIVHVAPPSKDPVPEETKAFTVPCGTVVRLHVGVWHLAPFSLEGTTHVMICLPERTYFNDCTVVNYKEEEKIEVVI